MGFRLTRNATQLRYWLKWKCNFIYRYWMLNSLYTYRVQSVKENILVGVAIWWIKSIFGVIGVKMLMFKWRLTTIRCMLLFLTSSWKTVYAWCEPDVYNSTCDCTFWDKHTQWDQGVGTLGNYLKLSWVISTTLFIFKNNIFRQQSK